MHTTKLTQSRCIASSEWLTPDSTNTPRVASLARISLVLSLLRIRSERQDAEIRGIKSGKSLLPIRVILLIYALSIETEIFAPRSSAEVIASINSSTIGLKYLAVEIVAWYVYRYYLQYYLI